MYPWGDNRRFNSYAAYFRRTFGHRIQKVAVNAGFTCPNRDGTVGRGGCTFCDNAAFTPSYCTPAKSVTQQIDEGIEFHRRRYRTAGSFLVYFQSFSNTYAPLADLRRLYDEALAHPDVAGIVIGTRPDCVNSATLDLLADLSRQTFVIVEYGIESANDDTLKRINRGHTFGCACRAIKDAAERGIMTGGHVILGLPGEDREECLRQAYAISAIPLDILKIHQLQIVKGTAMAEEYARRPFKLYSPEEYVSLLTDYIERLRKDIVLDRFTAQTPADMLIAPRWGLKNHEFADMLANHMRRHGARQGRLSR